MPIVQLDNKNYFETSFLTTFADTNVVGNVYFANYVVWQGKCRELFLAEYCREVLADINGGLALVTLDLSCRYIEQLRALEKVVMRMNVEELSESRMLMSFQYYRQEGAQFTSVCQSHQSVASMREIEGTFVTVPFPSSMVEAIREYNLVA
jgi:enediyne core biosynthesis thioesterase